MPDRPPNAAPFDHVLAVLGAVVAALPIAAMLVTSLFGSLARGRFLMDYLMPAELAPVLAVGALLLLIAAWHARRGLAPVATVAATALVAFAATAAVSVWTGLADGTYEPVGWRLVVVLIPLVVYVLAAVALPLVGWHLVRALRPPRGSGHGPPAAHPTPS